MPSPNPRLVAESPPRARTGASADRDSLSAEELRERKRPMATRWDQVVLPVGRLQDRVDASVGRLRWDMEGLARELPVHGQPDAVEDLDGRLEHQEVQPCRRARAVVVCRRVRAEVERVVQRVEVAPHWDGGPCG